MDGNPPNYKCHTLLWAALGSVCRSLFQPHMVGERPRARGPWRAHPPPKPVPLLADGVHGGLGPVQLLLFAAQHGGQALILFPQPSQLLLPARPLFSQAGIQVPAQHPFNLLDCLENTATKTSQGSDWEEGEGQEQAGQDRESTEKGALQPLHCRQESSRAMPSNHLSPIFR